MTTKRTFRLFPLMLLLWAASCNMQTVKDEPLDTAETQSFDASYADVVLAAREGIKAMKLDITDAQEKEEGFVFLFVRPFSMTQYGGVGRLVVDRGDAPPTAVHVNYERRVVGISSGQERYARLIFDKMRNFLSLKRPSPSS